MRILETFFSVEVADMDRATAFYSSAFGATVAFATARWTSIHVAGVRLGLALNPDHAPSRTGLHFAVEDLDGARKEVERCGGKTSPPVEVAPGVVIAEATDSEGNQLVLAAR